MSEQTTSRSPRGRKPRASGGRKSKGERRSRTLRVPILLDDEIEEAFEAAGYDNVNDFLLDIIRRAQAAGLWPDAANGQRRLPIGA
jgi:ABC-type iron transport system FetAB ATPase subunit